jgi:NTE family protein
LIGVQGSAPQHGIALCLSGGGYRAMLFHAGALWRLNESGYLGRLDRVSSVSGGSIAAGVLASRWSGLRFDDGRADNFTDEVVAPIRAMAGRTLDWKAVVGALFLPGGPGNRVAAAYRRHLFGRRTLRDLPHEPRFAFNATNLQTGVLWRFERPYMADQRVGIVRDPEVPLAVAVAASSALPPFLSPLRLKLDPDKLETSAGADLHRPPYTQKAVLTDGSVYDNLGLEAAFKDFSTVLISDGGGQVQPAQRVASFWPLQLLRIANVIDSQVRSLRKHDAIDDFLGEQWRGAYWGIRTDISHYELSDSLPCDPARTQELAEGSTRLVAMKDDLQERLINWGYAVCDAALRRHVNRGITPPGAFPYPGGV